jgi:hypothetical protein
VGPRPMAIDALLMAVALTVALVLSPSAVAGAYRVYTCQAPGGVLLGPAIAGPDPSAGWTYSVSGQNVPVTVEEACPITGGFRLVLHSGHWPTGAGGAIRWSAPPETRLTAMDVRVWLDMETRQELGTLETLLATDRAAIIDQQSPAQLGWVTVRSANLDATWLELGIHCIDDCSNESATAIVEHAWFDVSDDSSPVGGLSGSALDAQRWSGVVSFGLNAADQGGGLRRAVVEVDQGDALEVSLASGDSNCTDFDPTTPALAEYTAARPCPLRIDNGSLDIDTAQLPQGRHVVRVLLEDAAGNRTPIFGPVTRNIAAGGAVGPGSDPALRGAANGDGASDQASLTAHWGKRSQRILLVSRFGRTHVVRGRLRAQDGAPIANAAIDVVSKTTANNARELAKRGGPRTRSDGSWYLVLPRRVSSRTVTLRYRSHVNDTIPSATASVRLRVRAGLRLAIHPRRARRGEAIHFSGRLLGAPLPRGGKQIVLIARASRGAWVRFNVVRSDRRGRFRATYRFQQPGAASYRFRALSLAEAAYPYLAGGSNVVVVSKR